MYDFYPYMAGGYFCHCSECEKLWKDYSREKLGEPKPMPVTFEFPDPVSVAYYKFRMESFADFMKETAAAAKAVNPAFSLLQNHNLNNYDAPYQLLLGGLDPPTTEFWGLDCGQESALYLPQLAEALGAERLYAYYNAASQYTPSFRYKVNLAEFYAVTGGLMHQPDAENTAAGFFDFVSARKPVYAGSRSIAKTGILYSWESELFSWFSPALEKGYAEYRENISRQAASALVKAGVPSDFVALEREGVLDRLSQYDVLVVPEYAYFEEDTWKEPVRAFAQRGGRLVVTGGKAGAARRSAGCEGLVCGQLHGGDERGAPDAARGVYRCTHRRGCLYPVLFHLPDGGPIRDGAAERLRSLSAYHPAGQSGGTGKYGRLLHIYTAG